MTVTQSYTQKNNSKSQKKQWLFKDFLQKYEPSEVLENFQAKYALNKKEKVNLQDDFENLIKGIDPTEELISLEIPKGKAYSYIGPNGRRAWAPTGQIRPGGTLGHDQFYLRERLNELCKLAIYQCRDKLINVQKVRKKYHNTSMYKMGYMFSKADQQVRIFTTFTYRTFSACGQRMYDSTDYETAVTDFLEGEERVLSHMFNLEILVDLIQKNDENLDEVFNFKGRKKSWVFVDKK